jgi:hypothetical protein
LSINPFVDPFGTVLVILRKKFMIILSMDKHISI